MGRLLGLDIGDKRIGVSVSDLLMLTAQALTTYAREAPEKDLIFFKEIIKDHDIDKIICGLPKNMDGTLGEQAQKTKDYAEFLKENLNIPIEYWDERLTTQSAKNVLLEADVSRGKRKKVIDKIAAVFILQSYMDAAAYKRG